MKGINKFLKEYPNAQQCFFGKLPIFSIKGRFTDIRDAQSYEYVKIGKQIWMAENLAFKTSSGSWAYDNDENNVDTYGRLYDWETAIKACPEGWHLPSDDEWKQLEIYLGMSESEVGAMNWRGIDEGKKMKSTSGWHNNDNGTNFSGFNGLPGGNRDTDGSFDYLGRNCDWWSSSINSSKVKVVWGRGLDFGSDQVNRGRGNKEGGVSIRCVKDSKNEENN